MFKQNENEQAIPSLVVKQRHFFHSSTTQSYDFRIDQLRKLREALIKFDEPFKVALKKDLGKPEFEAMATETGFVLHSLNATMKQLKKWMKPKRVKTPLLNQPASSRIHYVPLGVNLIISPFNFPVLLTFSPLLAAMAAGNTVVVKTSELTPHVSQVIQTLIEETFDPQYIAFVAGEVAATTLLLQQKFDHIFFTGSARVGSIVMQAAAKQLTPVTLELGGKSPCIVHKDANMDVAVERIVAGKFLNNGQTCVAPDYVLIHKSVKDEFLEKIKQAILKRYGDDASLSPIFGRIVNEHHCERVIKLIDQHKVIVGGQFNQAERYIAPTVMKDVTLQDNIMAEEIFGPVLPVLDYESFDDVYATIAQLPQHPLACYVYSDNKAVQDELMANIQFGGGCINHCVKHLTNRYLPFGGVGESGIGHYHGFHGFERFSHQKSILKAATWFDLSAFYSAYKMRKGK